MARRGGRRVGR
uniref:Uncharacterized protein n=1 Tax=Arundo donax TaxID=35708 RepID=A0A0A9DAJ7_ARUDO